MINKICILLLLFFSFYYGCIQPESVIGSSEGNQSPVINSVSANPPVIKVGSAATIKVSAEDPEREDITYKWSSVLGDIIGSGSEVQYIAAYCCIGTSAVHVTVTDSRGAKTSATINIEVIQ